MLRDDAAPGLAPVWTVQKLVALGHFFACTLGKSSLSLSLSKKSGSVQIRDHCLRVI